MTKGVPMTQNDSWHFPIVPTLLTGLMLEHISRLQAMILEHGMLVGHAQNGLVYSLKVKEPEPMTLILIGSAEMFSLLVLDSDGSTSVGFNTIQVDEPNLRGCIIWNPLIPIADVLTVLDTEMVIKTSELSMSSSDGPN